MSELALDIVGEFLELLELFLLRLTDPRSLLNKVLIHGESRQLEQVLKALSLEIVALRLRVGNIGLGIGTIATYSRPGDTYRFYEINPDVDKIARTYFTHLEVCLFRYCSCLPIGRPANGIS